MTAEVIALAQQKGGVGKTTTTYHQTRAAHRAGRRTLVVDLDPQGNLTSALAAEDLPEDAPGLADTLTTRDALEGAEVIVPTIWDGVDIIPTVGETLGVVRDELVIAGTGRESRLRRVLDALRQSYDLILIDCPPSLDLLTINGLTAADRVVIVTESKLFSATGLAKLLDTIGQVREYYNPSLTIAAGIVNRFEAQTTTARHWLPELEQAAERNGFKILTPPVPKRTIIGDSTEMSKGLDELPGDARDLAAIYDGYLEQIEGARP